MKLPIATLMIALAAFGGGTAVAQSQQAQTSNVPWFLQPIPQSLQSVVGTWHQFVSAKTALDPKEKYLIALAVAAQIPCQYCVYANTQSAKQAGATEEQIHDAIAVAGFTRMLSTVVQGNQTDFQKFKATIDKQTAAK
jgi:AhpD family alkylhydroperoxidase